MKKYLILIAVFVVTWNKYRAEESPNPFFIVGGTTKTQCVIVETTDRKEFATKSEASRFAEDIGKDRKNWDVKIFQMEEVK